MGTKGRSGELVNKSLEDQNTQHNTLLPTPEKNDVATIEESFVLHNSDSKQDSSHKVITFVNAIETRLAQWKKTERSEKEMQHTLILWEMELRKEDAIWQKMLEQNRQIDLYSLCLKY